MKNKSKIESGYDARKDERNEEILNREVGVRI